MRPNLEKARVGQWDLLVVVPAHNEEQTIAASLVSVLFAIREASPRLRDVKVVVVADRCTDQTAPIVRLAQRDNDTVMVSECSEGNVARARAFGVAIGRGALATRDPGMVWVANTDADTIVPSDWIARQIAFADRHACGVAGVVEVHEFADLPSTAPRHFEAHYLSTLPASGSHPHVHAANLGFRLDAYDRAGGWGRLPRSEDRDLWSRLQRTGADLVAAADLRVVTSGRAVGRVPGGFADWLCHHVTERDRAETRESWGLVS